MKKGIFHNFKLKLLALALAGFTWAYVNEVLKELIKIQ
tara:strand:- start:265 stop:378 length:114 start_codon:yes stop_codon:yes gene_type:complete